PLTGTPPTPHDVRHEVPVWPRLPVAVSIVQRGRNPIVDSRAVRHRDHVVHDPHSPQEERLAAGMILDAPTAVAVGTPGPRLAPMNLKPRRATQGNPAPVPELAARLDPIGDAAALPRHPHFVPPPLPIDILVNATLQMEVQHLVEDADIGHKSSPAGERLGSQ